MAAIMRYRWGIGVGSLGHRKEVAKDVMRDKACDVDNAKGFLHFSTHSPLSEEPKFPPASHLRGPFWGPFIGPQMGAIALI